MTFLLICQKNNNNIYLYVFPVIRPFKKSCIIMKDNSRFDASERQGKITKTTRILWIAGMLSWLYNMLLQVIGNKLDLCEKTQNLAADLLCHIHSLINTCEYIEAENYIIRVNHTELTSSTFSTSISGYLFLDNCISVSFFHFQFMFHLSFR